MKKIAFFFVGKGAEIVKRGEPCGEKSIEEKGKNAKKTVRREKKSSSPNGKRITIFLPRGKKKLRRKRGKKITFEREPCGEGASSPFREVAMKVKRKRD